MRPFIAVFSRDMALVMRQKTEVLTGIFFFVMVTSLFPLGLGSELKGLSIMAPGVIWVAALLSSIVGLQRLFLPDFLDGTLEQMVISPTPLWQLILAKIGAHWLVSGFPLIWLCPFLGLQLGLEGSDIKVLMLTLALGTPILSLVGGIGAALTLGARGGGVLVTLLVLPLLTPVLIFGSGAVIAHQAGLDIQGHLSLLAALLLGTLVMAPWAITASIQVALE